MKIVALFAVCLSILISVGVQAQSAPDAPKAMTVPQGVAAFGWDF